MTDALAGHDLFVPPGPGPGWRDPSILQQLANWMRRPIEAWPRAVFEERMYRPPVPGLPIFLMDPAAIRAVFVDEAESFPQGALFRRMLRPIWGKGMLTAEGAAWRSQRHAALPAFRPAQMRTLVPAMRRPAEAALERWRGAGPDAAFDIAEECARMTFDVILDTMLSGGEDFDRSTMRGRIGAFVSQLSRMRPSYFLAPDSHHEARVTPATPEAALLRADVERMIARRRHAPPQGDLIDLLMAAQDPDTGAAIDDATLRDNLLGFIVAGHETSAVALAWSIYLVSSHEPTLARVRAEIAEVAGAAPVVAEQVDRLVFTRQVLSEALRLYPPAHILTRVCTRTIRVGGVEIKKGARIIVPVYALHRHRLWWTNPDAFDPDRFGPGKPTPDRHVYMPFGAGPRICLGASFAMTELVTLLATLVREASFTVEPGHRVWPSAGLALKPEGGLPMRVTTSRLDRPADPLPGKAA